MIRRHIIPMTVTAWGGGTFFSSMPLAGEILSLGIEGTALGGTADYTITRMDDGGTVVALTNYGGGTFIQPRQPTHTQTGGTTSYNLGVGPVADMGIPCEDYLKVVVAQAAASATENLFVYYRQ